jgi:peptidoglycan/xylan/chitin deacetylase (PgdA/CDA1 family)
LVLAVATLVGSAPATHLATTVDAPNQAAISPQTAVAAPGAGRPIVVRDSIWYARDSLSTGPATVTFAYGRPGDVPVSGDWDGNGTNTPGVVRGRTWFLRNSNTGGTADISFGYGSLGDVPVVGDWDGNGTFTPGVVRGKTWYLSNSNTGGTATVEPFTYGTPADMPVSGDWDGNGTFTPGVVRGNTWYLSNANTSGAATVEPFPYGRVGDRPVVGDWDDNQVSTPGIVRGRTWYLRNTNTAGAADTSFQYGSPCDLALSSESAFVRDRGGRPLRSSFVGNHMSVLPTTSKVVALTFDAGANADGVPKILATLQSECVPAAFFLTGEWARNFPQYAAMIGLRFPVGNHTDTHPHLVTLTDSAVRNEVIRGQAAIQSAAKYDTHPLFRFPFGESDARTLSLVNGLNYASIRWTVDTLGWQGTSEGQSVSTVVSRVLGSLRPGEIVLMHVGSHPTDRSTLDADALPTIISELRARGYSFVTVMQYM